MVMDAYSIKPIDSATLTSLAHQVEAVVTVEDHWMEGGIGDAVLEALAGEKVAVHKIAVTKMPRSGTPSELLAYEGIDCAGIVSAISKL
jgi:transketolase